MRRQSYIGILLFACLIVSCTNQELEIADKTPKQDNKPGSYQAMDYGPVLSESIRLAGSDSSLVRKGLAIRLDHGAAFIFDTDLVGMAAGTVGGWLDISKTDYTNYKGSDIAAVEGRQVFGSKGLAGWAKDGNFEGRRQDEGMGRLPTDWAQYKGYYQYGDKVLLSYSVGGTDVYELPAAVKYKGALAFTRTIKIAATDQPMEALMLKMHDSWSVGRTTDHEIIVNTGTSALAVSLVNASKGVKLKVEKDGLTTLHVPPSDSTQMIRVGIFKIDSPDDELLQKLPEHLENTKTPSFETMMQGGPSRWNKTIKTPGILSEKDSGYVLDQIPVPFKNPWGSWMRLSGIDFFADGERAAVTTWNGDVWIVSGLDKSLKNIKWRRFASGLFYPMGVAIVEGQIYVTERSQLTRLHDLNGDGEADYYENFNNDGIVYPMAHSLGLEVDSEGYFYFFKNGNRVPSEVPQHGALMRVSPNGGRREVYARGFRGANTLGIGPDDNILTVDQEGNWVPVDRMSMVETKGGFYGYRPHGGEGWPVGEFKVPVAWFPHTVENSGGFMIYANDSRWGPLAGHWIMSSYGQRTLFEVLMEEIDGRFQGGIVQLPEIKSKSGAMRASINTSDGQLYMVGLGAWGSTATIEGSFERIRYAGGGVSLPKALRVTPRGVEITFRNPLNPTSATDVKNYEVERWEYLYSKHYGSPEISLSHPLQKGQDNVVVSSATIGDDARTVLLKIPDMQSVMQMQIAYNLKFTDGQEAVNTIYHTVNWLSVADTDKKPEWQQRILSGRRNSLKKTESFNKRQRLISENECKSCHAMSGKSFGPSFMKIARRYKKDQKMIDQLSNKIIEGGRGNWGQQAMPPHPTVTTEDVEKMVKYILSLSKDR